ncbi:non-ribosomal peptide synthetase [Azotobacter chroococcum]|uniref:non-ribosomal peptide synthetase n=1 Tax=Azotobacter chroococcum TaxID=353 RepID=UPI000B773294|nr:non-ribosomal peptide synthetase [Azotobacter chroococcum]
MFDVSEERAAVCESLSESCPLTGLQHAYWVGEQKVYKFHTVPFLYFCYFTEDLDIPRLETALQTVLEAYPELSMEFLSDGTQRPALEPVGKVSLELTDWRGQPPIGTAELQDLRKKGMEEKLALLGARVQVTAFLDRVADGYYVNFAFRLISFDAFSVRLFYNALVRVYNGMGLPEEPRAFFAEFMAKRQALKQTSVFQRSMQYWQERIATLRNAPELPVVEHERMPDESRLRRIRFVFGPERVARLNEQARKLGISPSMLFCTAYTDVLRLWSRNRDFTINMLMSHRPSGDPRFQRAFGNFGSTLLLESVDAPGLFVERARVLQRQLARDIRHSRVEGVDVIRAMGSTGTGLPVMPVVFASSLGLDLPEGLLLPNEFGLKNMGGGLHTPQVWLDCQVYMYLDELVLNWDYVEGLFLPGVIENMFAAFEQQIEAILQHDAPQEALLLPRVPPQALLARQAANQTGRALPTGRLEHFVAEACARYPERAAIIAADRVVDYQSLWGWSTSLAASLRQAGVGADDLVAVVAKRGWRQVTALLGVVQSGAAYLPITSDQPAARKEWLIARPGVKVVLIERELATGLSLPPDVRVLLLEDALPDAPPPAVALEPALGERDLAYVIFTSGSTGQPKGVAIDHRGAVNTIQDVIARFGLSCEDRMIGLSSFNFDLSVHDIFGSLAVGAALVLPPHSETPAPDQWAACVREHGVTVWNTVPASLEMLIEFLGPQAAVHLHSLRLVMLSGDWIPITLPERLKKVVPGVTLISLGGATEASIWSNYFPVERVAPGWKSIPYGWPLSNQSFHVLTRELEPAPDWVPGDLYIGGIGLAREYYGDPARTAESFIIHPQTGERLYRTGDVGRYFEDGCLEFLGRLDGQVKIRGFRIELEEIDANLARCPGIRAVTTVAVRSGDDSRLVAFYQPSAEPLEVEAIRAHLATALPPYMIPSQFMALYSLPVTANGKVDRKALSVMADALGPEERPRRSPGSETERRLAGLWSQLLGIEELGVDDEFFELGGTSLLAVRLINAITSEFGQTLPLVSLLRHGTIAAQAAMLEAAEHAGHQRTPLAVLREGGQATLAVVHPVGGNILCYRELIELLPAGVTLLGLQSPGDGAPRRLDELAAGYVDALCSQVADPASVHLLGWSMGGVIAQEMARQMEARGIAPNGVTMIDSWMAAPQNEGSLRLEGEALLLNFLRDLLSGEPLPIDFDSLSRLEEAGRPAAIVQALKQAGGIGSDLSRDEFLALLGEYRANYDALVAHAPRPTATPTRLYRASRSMDFPLLAPFALAEAAHLDVIDWEGDHFSVVERNSLREILAHLSNAAEVALW